MRAPFTRQLVTNSLKLVAIGIMLLAISYQLPAKTSALWNPFGQACDKSVTNTSSNNVCSDTSAQNGTTNNPISGPRGAIHEAANVFALVTVVGGLIIAGYSAYVFVTAGGARSGDNASRARNARTSLTSALTGVAIASLAWLIVTYVTTHIIH